MEAKLSINSLQDLLDLNTSQFAFYQPASGDTGYIFEQKKILPARS